MINVEDNENIEEPEEEKKYSSSNTPTDEFTLNNDEELHSKQDDEKKKVTDILQNLGDYPIEDIIDANIDFDDDVDLFGTKTKPETLKDSPEFMPKVYKTSNGQEYLHVYENFGYCCSSCGAEVPIKSTSCPNCNIRFTHVKCEKCRYVGIPDEFKEHTCPQCQISPVQLPKEALNVHLCPGCNRPYNVGNFSCKLCGWIDFGALSWFAVLIIFVAIVIPLFSFVFRGIISEILFNFGLIFGGLLLWNFGHAIIKVFSQPRRYSFYWFCAIISILIVVLL
ncbi:MAG: hypothetical protein K8S87_09435 [Planctomycetes bacterium]|nr:hypothetical protein [Planctomycetota bacterium]